MKKHQLLFLLAVAIVLGLAGIYFQISQSGRWNGSKTDRTILQNLAVNDVTKIQIRSLPATVTLEKKGDEWRVTDREDYPADFTKIRDLIKMLWELKAGQEMQVGPSQLGRLQLLRPGQGTEAGIEIDLKGEKEKQIGSLILGKSVDRTNAKAGAAANGRFVYNPTVKDSVYLVSESFYSVDPVTVASWLDKTFIAPGELAEVSQAAWSNNPGWKVSRKDPQSDWQLQDSKPGETLDKPFAQSFSTFAPTFVDVRPQSISPAETGLKEPFRVSIKTFDGFTYDLLLGKEGPDKTRYLQLSVSANLVTHRTPGANESVEDKKKKDEEFDQKAAALKERLEKEKRFEKWVFLVPDWNVEQILKRRDEILAKPSPSPSSAEAPLPGAASAPSPNLLLPEASATASPTPTASAVPTEAASPTASPASSPTPGS